MPSQPLRLYQGEKQNKQKTKKHLKVRENTTASAAILCPYASVCLSDAINKVGMCGRSIITSRANHWFYYSSFVKSEPGCLCPEELKIGVKTKKYFLCINDDISCMLFSSLFTACSINVKNSQILSSISSFHLLFQYWHIFASFSG